MKKNIKLVLALILAAMMIVGSFSAIAADETPRTIRNSTPDAIANSESYDRIISISGLDTGDVAHFYQVLQWVGSKDADADNVVIKGWEPTAAFKGALTEAEWKAVLGVDGVTKTGITADIAAKLAAVVTASTTNTEVAENGGIATMDVPEGKPGLYMALITPADQDTIYSPVFVSSDFNPFLDPTASDTSTIALSENEPSYSQNGGVKKSKTELDKVASTSEDKWDDGAWQDGKIPKEFSWATTAIGDKVHFTVTTTIPAMNTYSYPKFVVTDSLTDLRLVKNTVTITAPANFPAANYTIDPQDDGYTIEFKDTYLKTVGSPVNITIEYDAIVTTTADLNVNLEKNEVSTQFRNNPSSSEDKDISVKKDITKHYTFSIDADALYGGRSASGRRGSEIVKVGRDANGEPITSTTIKSSITEENEWVSPLAGAVFGLYVDEGCTEPYYPKDPTKNDESRLTTPLTQTTGADGRMNFPGLDAGTYYLKEITAPDGYVKNNTPAKIVIDATYVTVSATEYYDPNSKTWSFENGQGKKPYTYEYDELASYSVTINGQNVTTHTFMHDSTSSEIAWSEDGSTELPTSIVNVKGVELPSTGGIGTTIFYVGGSLMVLAAAILLITKRRMGVED